jgi:hypothetical protein
MSSNGALEPDVSSEKERPIERASDFGFNAGETLAAVTTGENSSVDSSSTLLPTFTSSSSVGSSSFGG